MECHWIRRPHPRDSGDHEEEENCRARNFGEQNERIWIKKIDSNFVYTWSGRDTHADHGVGFIVDEQHSQAIVEIRPINLRIIHMKIQANNVI